MAPKDVEKIGKQLTEGALSAIGKWAIIAALGIAAWHWAWPPARDATDPPSGPRSGMQLRTDSGTGCQYLETKGGALTPRMDRAGRQVCTQRAAIGVER